MKKTTYLFIFVTILFCFGCRKPQLGDYDLKLNYDDGVEASVQLEEISVKKNIIYYGGDRFSSSGYLHKSKNNVSGEIQLDNPKPALSSTLYLKGKISGNGFLQYKITGTFTTSSYYSGTFIMTRYKK